MSTEDNKGRSTTSRIFEKVEKIEAHLYSIDTTLARQHSSLEEHMRRTQLLEEEMKPVARHVEQMRGAGKLLALLALIATIVSVFMALN